MESRRCRRWHTARHCALVDGLRCTGRDAAVAAERGKAGLSEARRGEARRREATSARLAAEHCWLAGRPRAPTPAGELSAEGRVSAPRPPPTPPHPPPLPARSAGATVAMGLPVPGPQGWAGGVGVPPPGVGASPRTLRVGGRPPCPLLCLAGRCGEGAVACLPVRTHPLCVDRDPLGPRWDPVGCGTTAD